MVRFMPGPFPVTKEQFREWIEKQPDNVAIGRRMSTSDCPCAQCFQELTNSRVVQVWSTDVYLDDKHYDPPIWLRDLVRKIDSGLRTMNKQYLLDLLERTHE